MVDVYRAVQLMKYANLMQNEKFDKINEEIKPKNGKEENWITKRFTISEINNANYNSFLENKEKAYAEAEEILRKYLPKEYWNIPNRDESKIDGYFNSKEFIRLQKNIYRKLLKELRDVLDIDIGQKLKKEELSYNGQQMYLILRLSQVLKKDHNIDWMPISWIAPEEYKKEMKELKEKYKGISFENY